MTAQITAEGLPVRPVVDGAPVAESTPEEAKRRRRKKALLLLLLGLLAMLATIATWYLIFRQPITPLPLPGIPTSEMPSFTTSVYGAAAPTGVAVSPSGDRIYVVQSESDRIGLVLDASGNKVGTMAPPESTGTCLLYTSDAADE